MKSKPQVPKIQSAHAILTLDGNFILQLRDNKPTIAAAGQWSLFGGKIKAGETPLQTIRREVVEELSINLREYKQLWFEDYYAPLEKSVIRTWFFEADATKMWGHHKLKEGRAARSFRFEEITSLDMPAVVRKTLNRHYNQQQK